VLSDTDDMSGPHSRPHSRRERAVKAVERSTR
jgi:hypothetical protein